MQRIYDILPANIEQHLILESRDKEANYEDIRRRALTWVMTHTSGRTPMIDSLNEDRNEDEDFEYQDTFGGEVMGFEGEGKGGGKGKGEFFGRCFQCGQWGHSAKFCPTGKGKGKQGGQKGEQKGFKGESWRKGYKGFRKGGKSAGGKDSPWGKGQGPHQPWSAWKRAGKGMYSFSVDQHEESLEYDLLSVEVCSKGCGRKDDWCHVPVKQHKSFEKGCRKVQRLRIIENQVEVLGNLDEENVDSEGESTAIPSDNGSEISEGTWVVDCRSTTDSRRKRRTPNRKIESGAVNILEKHGDKNNNSVEDRLWNQCGELR